MSSFLQQTFSTSASPRRQLMRLMILGEVDRKDSKIEDSESKNSKRALV
jgi:hypothetical protein